MCVTPVGGGTAARERDPHTQGYPAKDKGRRPWTGGLWTKGKTGTTRRAPKDRRLGEEKRGEARRCASVIFHTYQVSHSVALGLYLGHIFSATIRRSQDNTCGGFEVRTDTANRLSENHL